MSHGAHLPIDTDTLIASFIADKLTERNNWILLPPITYTIAVPVDLEMYIYHLKFLENTKELFPSTSYHLVKECSS